MPRDRSARKAAAVTPAGQRPFTTSRGVVVTLKPYSGLAQSADEEAVRQTWLAEGRALPAKPTYTLTAAGGVVETHEHDEITIKGDAEATAAWAKWQADEAAFQQAVSEVTVRGFILDYMEFAIDPAWAAKARAKRVTVPTDAYEAKVYYGLTEVLATRGDVFEAFALASELAGVTGPQLEAAREAFRGAVGK